MLGHLVGTVTAPVLSSVPIGFLGASVRNFLAVSELGNLDLDGLVQTTLEFWAIAKEEQNLHPYEQRGQDDRLEKVVE